MKLLTHAKLLISRLSSAQRSGAHEVGTVGDQLRAPAKGGRPRSISIRAWYPTGSRIHASDNLLRRIASTLRDALRQLTLGSAPMTRGTSKFPLIIYVPGERGRHDENVFMLANLASQGFVLAALEDPFDGAASDADEQEPEASLPIEDASLYERRVRSGVQTSVALLDALAELPAEGHSAWAERLDTSKVGILGYSLGGAVAAEATLCDSRFVAATNLDGPVCGEAAARGVSAPYLLLHSDFSIGATGARIGDASLQSNSSARLHEYRCAQRQAALPESHAIEVLGTTREHFSDRLMFPAPLSFWRGRLPGYRRIRAIIDSYTVAFFKAYLMAEPQPLMCVRHSPYAEVRFITPFRQSQTESPWAN